MNLIIRGTRWRAGKDGCLQQGRKHLFRNCFVPGKFICIFSFQSHLNPVLLSQIQLIRKLTFRNIKWLSRGHRANRSLIGIESLLTTKPSWCHHTGMWVSPLLYSSFPICYRTLWWEKLRNQTDLLCTVACGTGRGNDTGLRQRSWKGQHPGHRHGCKGKPNF